MNISYLFGSFPIIYSGFMFYRSPQLADSLIVLSLTALAGLIFYLSKPAEKQTPNEIDKIEQEYHLEMAKAKLEQLKFDVSNRKAARDEGMTNGNAPKIFF